jgi:hypothetical protein
MVKGLADFYSLRLILICFVLIIFKHFHDFLLIKALFFHFSIPNYSFVINYYGHSILIPIIINDFEDKLLVDYLNLLFVGQMIV